MRFSTIAKAFLICFVVLVGALFTAPLGSSALRSNFQATRLGPPASAPFDHIVTILMENQGLCDVYTGCGGSATYQSQLANQNTLVMTWGTINHNSEPNYIALLGAINDGSTSGDGVCCYFETTSNLIDKIEAAGLTWQAFAEDASNSGLCSFGPPRSGDHFPFIDFQDMNTASRCSHFLTTTSSSDDEFISSLTTSAPNFVWLTPNDCDNGHNTCSSSSGLAGGDSYLSQLVPRIMSSPLFSASGSKATLLILYDEGYTQCNNTGGTGECVYASFSGPAAKKAQQIGPANASHYSYSSMIEAAWELSSINQNDVAAPNMLSAFGACTTNCTTSTPSTGGSPGGFLGLSNTIWLLIVGGLVGLVAALTLVTVRARGRAKKARQLSAN
jgi:hypothetical protein